MPMRYPTLRARLDANSAALWLHERNSKHPWTLKPCRVWTGALNASGYAKINVRGRRRHKYGPRKGQLVIKSQLGHRVALADHLGVRVSDLKHVCHKCDNKPCIEVTHLWSTTQSKNMLDMVKKGRHRNQYSERKVA